MLESPTDAMGVKARLDDTGGAVTVAGVVVGGTGEAAEVVAEGVGVTAAVEGPTLMVELSIR